MQFVIGDNDDLRQAKESRGLIQAEWNRLYKIRGGTTGASRVAIEYDMERLNGYIGDLDTAIEQYRGGPRDRKDGKENG